MKARISKSQARGVIKLVLRQYLEFFLLLKSIRDGELVWPEHLIAIKNSLNLNNYVELYDDEKKIKGAMQHFLHSSDELEQLKVNAATKSDAEKQSDLDNFMSDLLNDGNAFIEQLKGLEFDSQEIPDEPSEPDDIKRSQYLFLSSLALFHNVFSIMVFGVRLTTLVKRAISGDDKSFLQAIKVDHTLLYQHPHFKQRFEAANKNQEKKFLDSVYEKQLSPSLNGRIKHRGLYAMFYFLDEFEVLDDFSQPELHELYLDCNLADIETPTYESSSFAKHLKRFKES